MRKYGTLTVLLVICFIASVPEAESRRRRRFQVRFPRGNNMSMPRSGVPALDLTDYCNRTLYDEMKQSCVDTFTPPNVTRRLEANIRWQDRELVKKFVENALTDSPVPLLQPLTGFAFLNISAGVYRKLCPNAFVPHAFVHNLELLFQQLHYILSIDSPRTELIKSVEAERTAAILLKCFNETVGKNYTADDCGEEIAVDQPDGTRVCPVLTYDFNVKLFDPLLDAIWHIYETVHSHCFPYFQNDNRMFHIYGYGFLDLFSDEIKARWTTVIEDEAWWERMLGPSYLLHLMNMELCTSDVVKRSKFSYRLGRETMPIRLRMLGSPD